MKGIVCRPLPDSENGNAIFPAMNGWAIFKPNIDFKCPRHYFETTMS
jgi:hypothetical protein